MLNVIRTFVGSMLSWFSSWFGGQYVLGLLVYALLFKLIFLPFAIKQQKNQIKMATLAPKIELIKAKYKGRTDQPTLQKQQQEIMELQQKEGYSPLSGCLPMLLQLPVIMFLYNIITKPLSYICGLTAEQINTIKTVLGTTETYEITLVGLIGKYNGTGLEQFKVQLDRLPGLEIFNANLTTFPSASLKGDFSWLFFIPIVAAGLTWLSMFLTRKWNANPAMQQQGAQANASMKMMDIMMPAMTLIMAYSLSSLMGIYWIYQSALGILQSYIISRTMPLPKYTEEELKEMKKAQKDAEKAARSAAKNAPKYRSLHYIDDEDYETLPELQTDEKKPKNDGELNITEI